MLNEEMAAKPASASRVSLAIITEPGAGQPERHASRRRHPEAGRRVRSDRRPAARGQGSDHDGRDRCDDLSGTGLRRRARRDLGRGDLRGADVDRDADRGLRRADRERSAAARSRWAMVCTWHLTKRAAAAAGSPTFDRHRGRPPRPGGRARPPGRSAGPPGGRPGAGQGRHRSFMIVTSPFPATGGTYGCRASDRRPISGSTSARRGRLPDQSAGCPG